MKAAPCSCRVRISLIEELRKLSTTSRFSSPGTPKMRSTPSFSSAATNKSEPFGISDLLILLAQSRNNRDCVLAVSIDDGRYDFNRRTMPCAKSVVEAIPPRSGVLTPSLLRQASMALRIRPAESAADMIEHQTLAVAGWQPSA